MKRWWSITGLFKWYANCPAFAFYNVMYRKDLYQRPVRQQEYSSFYSGFQAQYGSFSLCTIILCLICS